MSTKMLTAEQALRLGQFMEPYTRDGECYAEAAIRRIEELEERLRVVEEKLAAQEKIEIPTPLTLMDT